MWELWWTARLSSADGWQYQAGARLDWAEALQEVSQSNCPWLDHSCTLTWLSPEQAAAVPQDDLVEYD